MELHADQFGRSPRRRSRVRRESLGAAILLGRRDLAIFRLLERYRYLPSNFIHAFVGGNLTRFKQRLGTLFHEGYLDRPLAQWRNANARYRPAAYQLADKAKAALAEHGFAALHHNGSGGSFAHELMVAEIMASFELAARSDPALRHLCWPDLLDRAPAETRASANPFAFPVAIAYRDGRMTFDLKPDGRPFGDTKASNIDDAVRKSGGLTLSG